MSTQDFTRKAPNLAVKLASALLQMKRVDERGELVPVIPYEEAKTLTAKEIISRFQFDHWPILHAHGGPVEPWNIEPKLKVEHAIKTTGRKGESRLGDQANGDIQRAAKVKRIRVRNGFDPAKTERLKKSIPSRPFATRKMNGSWEKRE